MDSTVIYYHKRQKDQRLEPWQSDKDFLYFSEETLKRTFDKGVTCITVIINKQDILLRVADGPKSISNIVKKEKYLETTLLKMLGSW